MVRKPFLPANQMGSPLAHLEPSTIAIGATPPSGFSGLSVDRTMTVEEQARVFFTQVSSFYARFTLPEVIPQTPPAIPRPPMQELSQTLDPKHSPTTSTTKMREEDLKSMTYPAIFARAQHLLWAPGMRPAGAANVARALYDCRIMAPGLGDGEHERAWPGVKAHVIWCDMTVGAAAWAVAVLRCEHAAAAPNARRQMEIHTLEGGNHFVSAPVESLNECTHLSDLCANRYTGRNQSVS